VVADLNGDALDSICHAVSPPPKFHKIAIDKILIIGYNNCSGCISALNEKLIQRASLGSDQDI
jgi:hypothetical protein